MSQRRRYGRILPHQRDTNDEVEVIGGGLEIENYTTEMHETVKKSMDDRTRMDYRRRIGRIIKYWNEHRPVF